MRYLVLLLLCHLIWPSSARAEGGFDLFDAERGKEKTPPPVQEEKKPEQPVLPPPPAPPPQPQKDFTLEGTSRIGSRYSAMLVAPDGKKVSQRLRPDKPTPIEGYEEFTLLAVAHREVQIGYPEKTLCRTSNIQRGIQCSADGKTATLSMMSAKALPPSAPPMIPGQPPVNPFAAAMQGNPQDGMAPNPFAGMGGMATGQPPRLPPGQPQPPGLAVRATPQPGQVPGAGQPNAQPQRIRDQDVPPGMKVIRTQHGDRLVPER